MSQLSANVIRSIELKFKNRALFAYQENPDDPIYVCVGPLEYDAGEVDHNGDSLCTCQRYMIINGKYIRKAGTVCLTKSGFKYDQLCMIFTDDANDKAIVKEFFDIGLSEIGSCLL